MKSPDFTDYGLPLSPYTVHVVRGSISEVLEQPWERGRKAMLDSVHLAGTGDIKQAFAVLDAALAQATKESRDAWIGILCRHASVLCRHAETVAHIRVDLSREIHYAERAIPFSTDYRFAVYNFARLLLSDGQVGRAERYATEAYELSAAEGTEADRDLAAAILKQWPDIRGRQR